VDPSLGGSQRIDAVASTWAANPSPGSKVFYVVDEAETSDHLDKSLRASQLVTTPHFKYGDLPFRDRFIINHFNSAKVRHDCRWMAVVDDDAYVDTAVVVEQLRWVKSSEPHIIAPATSSGLFNGSLAHTSFKLFSEASVPILVDALQTCDYPSMDSGEIDVIRCLHKLRLQKAVAFQQLNSKLTIAYPGKDEGELTASFGAELRKTGCKSAMVLHKLAPEDMIIYHDLILHVPPCSEEIETVPY